MDKLMKPSRVDLDSNSTGACTKEWKHWRRTFENYLEGLDQQSEASCRQVEVANKLRVSYRLPLH